MTMPPAARKLALTAHIATSVGWVGAVAAFLALALTVLSGDDAGMVRAAYLIAEPVVDYVIVPLALASLATGIISSLTSARGLFRNYWVVLKLAMTVVSTVVLLTYTNTVGLFADAAADPGADPLALRSGTFLLHSGGGLVLLLASTVLAVYKPRGLTPYGQRKQRGPRKPPISGQESHRSLLLP